MRIKALLLRSLLVTALGIAPALARGATLGLTWNECAPGSGLALRTNACTNALVPLSLLPTFTLDAPVDSVAFLELVVDVIAEDPVLPDWWRLEPGGCNAGAMTGTGDYTGLGACTDPWNGGGTALVQVWSPGEPRGGANMARMIVTSSVLPANFASLQAGVEYYAAHLRLSLARGSGVGSCAGCLRGACLVLNSVQLGRLPGASPALVTVVPTSGGTPGIATWQNGHAECAAVPVRNRTWGAIKSLYR